MFSLSKFQPTKFVPADVNILISTQDNANFPSAGVIATLIHPVCLPFVPR